MYISPGNGLVSPANKQLPETFYIPYAFIIPVIGATHWNKGSTCNQHPQQRNYRYIAIIKPV